MDAGLQHRLPHGRRRHLDAVRAAVDPADPDLHPRQLGQHHQPRQGVHDRLPGDGDDAGRHLLRPRPHPLLHVLRGRADPDVPDHRRLGRPAARLFGLQVLPLHAGRLGADAAGAAHHVSRRRHHRHPDAAAARRSRPACSSGCGWPASPPSPSSCRCGRCTPGCRTPTSRRRRRAR